MGQVIEKVLYPGQATTMLGLLKYQDDFSKSQGMNQLWYKDTLTQPSAQNVGWNVRKQYVINSPDPKGTFSFRAPLKHIFGFCEDYDKVVYGLKHSLTLKRNNDEVAIFRANGVDPGRITLNKITWFMSHVIPADKDKMELYKLSREKRKIPVGYRMVQCDSISIDPTTSFCWRLSVNSSPEVPRFLIVGFQTDKSSSQEQNPSIRQRECKKYLCHVKFQQISGARLQSFFSETTI